MGETKPAQEPDIIEVYVYDDHSGVDCPFRRDVESIRTRPDGCDHPLNELKRVNGVWQDGCGLEGGRDVIPKHCPLRRAPTIIRLKAGE